MSVELADLSNIGFGAYRISTGNPHHAEALLHAFRSGCNLVDTSANYMNGESEALIGEVLEANPDIDAFVITKAGYVQEGNLPVMAELNSRGLALENLIDFGDDYKYSIHPDFLNVQLELSCSRLRRVTIDGFLLHNPEHYFEQEGGGGDREEYYAGIRRAFEFLEQRVADGVIRYYGVSSNTLPAIPGSPDATDLRRLLDCAEQVSTGHHFRLIQFPFNMFETQAAESHPGEPSLIELAQTLGITTFSNRPLNALIDGMTMRLATYEGAAGLCDRERDQQIFDDCVEEVRNKLDVRGFEPDPMGVTVMRFLRDNWMELEDTEAVERIFRLRLYPFLHQLYDTGMTEKEAMVYKRLHHHAELHARKTMTENALTLRRTLVNRGDIGTDDPRRLAQIICELYLEAGIDHVLVGMKRREYVDDLKELFRKPIGSIT